MIFLFSHKKFSCYSDNFLKIWLHKILKFCFFSFGLESDNFLFHFGFKRESGGILFHNSWRRNRSKFYFHSNFSFGCIIYSFLFIFNGIEIKINWISMKLIVSLFYSSGLMSLIMKKRGGGFSKLCNLSPQLQEFIQVPELTRTEVNLDIFGLLFLTLSLREEILYI